MSSMTFEFASALRGAIATPRNDRTGVGEIVTPNRTYQWQEFQAGVQRLQSVIDAHDGTIGVLLPNGFEAICVIAYCFLNRRTFTLLNLNLPTGMFDEMVKTAGVGLLITDQATTDRIGIELPYYLADTGKYVPSRVKVSLNKGPELACIVFTSGTTGKPKGVRLTR